MHFATHLVINFHRLIDPLAAANVETMRICYMADGKFPFPHEWLGACDDIVTMKTNPSIKSQILKFALPAIGCFALLGITSCGTMHGVGRDVEDAGEGIQKAAR